MITTNEKDNGRMPQTISIPFAIELPCLCVFPATYSLSFFFPNHKKYGVPLICLTLQASLLRLHYSPKKIT